MEAIAFDTSEKNKNKNNLTDSTIYDSQLTVNSDVLLKNDIFTKVGKDNNIKEEKQEQNEEEITVVPAVVLPTLLTSMTGEEEERMIYKGRAKLLRFDETVNEWKERGKGEIKFLQHNETGRIRLILRQDQTLKLRMNHYGNFLFALHLFCLYQKFNTYLFLFLFFLLYLIKKKKN